MCRERSAGGIPAVSADLVGPGLGDQSPDPVLDRAESDQLGQLALRIADLDFGDGSSSRSSSSSAELIAGSGADAPALRSVSRSVAAVHDRHPAARCGQREATHQRVVARRTLNSSSTSATKPMVSGHADGDGGPGRPATTRDTWAAMASQARQASISPASMPRASQPRFSCSHSTPSKPCGRSSKAAAIAVNRSEPTATARPAGRVSRPSDRAIEATTWGKRLRTCGDRGDVRVRGLKTLVRPGQGRGPAGDLGQHRVLVLAEQRVPPQPADLGEAGVGMEIGQGGVCSTRS